MIYNERVLIRFQGGLFQDETVPGTGKVLRSKTIITDGPYVETKEAINGYLVIKTDTLEQAVELAQTNPIFNLGTGGSIEIREISAL